MTQIEPLPGVEVIMSPHILMAVVGQIDGVGGAGAVCAGGCYAEAQIIALREAAAVIAHAVAIENGVAHPGAIGQVNAFGLLIALSKGKGRLAIVAVYIAYAEGRCALCAASAGAVELVIEGYVIVVLRR